MGCTSQVTSRTFNAFPLSIKNKSVELGAWNVRRFWDLGFKGERRDAQVLDFGGSSDIRRASFLEAMYIAGVLNRTQI